MFLKTNILLKQRYQKIAIYPIQYKTELFKNILEKSI